MTHGVCVQTDIQFNGITASKGILHFSDEGDMNFTTKRLYGQVFIPARPLWFTTLLKKNAFPGTDIKKLFLNKKESTFIPNQFKFFFIVALGTV